MMQFEMKILSLSLSLLVLQVCRANKIPQFVPQGYYIDLYPDLDIKHLKGSVIINIATYAEPTNVIELDADPSVSIRYKSIKVTELLENLNDVHNKTNYEITAVERVLFDSGKLRIHLNRKLLRDITYQVHIAFEKALRNVTDENEPFYIRTYKDDARVESKFFIMDLTRSGCYKAFPCFNEPAYKTWITLSVVRKNNFYTLSAAPINHTTPLNEAKSLLKDYFQSTPPLSLKSFALIVSNLLIPKPDSLFAERSNGIDAVLGYYEVPQYVLDQEKFNLIIKTLEEHLLIPFHSKVFNIMACPEAAKIPRINAYNLFILPKPNCEVEYVISLTSAILHQWFYHIATPVSTDSLIKPILTRFSWQISDKLMEKLNIKKRSEVGEDTLQFMYFVLYQDVVNMRNGTVFSNPNSIFINTMDNLYDSKLLTEAAHMLLRKKEFRMYSEQDIWHVLNEAANRLNKEFERTNYDNMDEVLKSWKEPGFLPLVNVQRDYENNQINITQEPFVFGKDEFKLSDFQQNASFYKPRMIPAVISHPNNYFTKKEFFGWVSDKTNSFHSKFLAGYDFIIFNPSYVGWFITNYDEHNWKMLMENFSSLPMSYKHQLLFDSMVLASIDKLDITYFLNMSLSISTEERDLPLWFNYERMALYLASKLHGQVGRKFKEYVFLQALTLVNNIQPSSLNSYLREDRAMIDHYKKTIKYTLDCLRNRAACFTLWEYEILMYEVRSGKSLSGEHNCEIIKNVSLSDWEIIANALFHVLQNNITYNKEQVLSILACTENPIAFETLMNLVFLNFNENGFSIDEQDQDLVLTKTNSLRDTNHKLLLKFVDKNFYILKERLSDTIWSHLIRVLVTTTKSDDDSKELFDFYKKYSGQFGVADEIMKKGLVIVSKQIRRETELYPVIDNWLNFALNKFDASV